MYNTVCSCSDRQQQRNYVASNTFDDNVVVISIYYAKPKLFKKPNFV